MRLVDQLTEIYLDEETHYAEEKKMSKEEADRHHRDMLLNERILVEYVGERVVGYVEFYLQHGCCFINDLFIRCAYRRTRVIWMLKKRLFEVCKGAKIYLGERNKYGRRYPESQIRSNYGK